jgi:hypothetical protein
MSNFFFSGKPLSTSTISSISQLGEDKSKYYDALSHEVSSVAPKSTLQKSLSGFFTDFDSNKPALDILADEIFGKNGGFADKSLLDYSHKGEGSDENSKNILSSVHVEGGTQPQNLIPVGKMWEKIKSLEAYVKQLEDERNASRVVQLDLERAQGQQDLNEDTIKLEDLDVNAPPPPLPPMMPPLPPPGPSMVPKFATDPSLEKIAKAKKAMKVNFFN